MKDATVTVTVAEQGAAVAPSTAHAVQLPWGAP